MMRALLPVAMFIAASALTAQTFCTANLAAPPSGGSANRVVVLEAYINDSGPYPFLLDTGSQVTMIDESLASELNLKPVSNASVVGVSLQGKSGKYALVNSVRVGNDAQVGSIYVFALDMKPMQDAGFAIRGLIGQDFLSHFDETIDNSHNRVCFNYASTPAAAPSTARN